MDNLTHSLVAASLGRAGLARKIPGGTVSLIVAANLADLDSISGFWGELYYLKYHRGFSHSIAGTFALAAVLTLALWLIGRVRGHPVPLAWICLAIFVAAGTHPLLDLTNSYGLRPFLPFLDRWYYGDLVFIIDPYLWLILGGAVFLSSGRRPLTTAAWAIAASLATTILIFAAVVFGLWIPLGIWLAGVGTVAFLKIRGRTFPPSLAAGALVGVLVYWGFLAAVHWITLQELYPGLQARYPGISRDAISATPRPANPFQWDLFVETAGHVAYARASSFSAEPLGFETIPRNQDQPAASAAASTCAGAVFTHFARFPVFQISEARDGRVVTIEDVRFTRLGRTRSFGAVTIRLDSPSEIPCPGEGNATKPTEPQAQRFLRSASGAHR